MPRILAKSYQLRAVACLLALALLAACNPSPVEETPTMEPSTALPPTETMASPTPSGVPVVSRTPLPTKTPSKTPTPSSTNTALAFLSVTPTVDVLSTEATPTQRPASTPRPTMRPTEAQTVVMRVVVTALNVRDAPNGAIIDSLGLGRIVTVRVGHTDAGCCRWRKIDFGPGWVAEYQHGGNVFMVVLN